MKLLTNYLTLLSFLLLVSLPTSTLAQTTESESEEKPVPDPTEFVSEHTGSFNGERIDYRVTAGEIPRSR